MPYKQPLSANHHLGNVADVGVEEFLAPIEAHFSHLTIPSKSITVRKSEFLLTLETMYQHDEGDDGIAFSKGLQPDC